MAKKAAKKSSAEPKLDVTIVDLMPQGGRRAGKAKKMEMDEEMESSMEGGELPDGLVEAVEEFQASGTPEAGAQALYNAVQLCMG